MISSIEKVTRQGRSPQYTAPAARSAWSAPGTRLAAEVLSFRTAPQGASSSRTRPRRLSISKRRSTTPRSSINSRHAWLYPTKTAPCKHRARVPHHPSSNRNSQRMIYHRRPPPLSAPHPRLTNRSSSREAARCRQA